MSPLNQDGGFVPECIRRPEIGLDLEIFNANAAADIQERMANFNELHFYDGTLSTNLTLEEAHVKIGFMLKVSFYSDSSLQFCKNSDLTARAWKKELIKSVTCRDQAFQRALAVHQVEEDKEKPSILTLSKDYDFFSPFIAATAGIGGSLSEKRKAARRARNRKKTSQNSQAVSLLTGPLDPR